MAGTDPDTSESRRFSIDRPRSLWVGVAAVVLVVGGFLMCGGMLALPVFIQRPRRADEAVRRTQAVENLKQIGHAIRKNAEQNVPKRLEAPPAGADSPEPIEPE